MRVSLNWLSDFVALDGIDIDELAHRLSMTGTKVETVHRLGGDVQNIVVAEVLAIEPHPNADNLSMVEVSMGSGDVERVVCGAKNFAVGDKVPFAAVGSRLPGLEITARKIRGEVSKGMLCSGAELGISKEASGLLILQPDAPLGEDVVPLLGLDDTIFELEVTANRPDCMSVSGVAREVAALYGRDLLVPEYAVDADAVDHNIDVKIEDPEGCPRYLARYLGGVKIGPSPAWVASRLLAAGIRPISNVVDATNYVLIELGQPMHAFDARMVTDRTIVVRRARQDEELTTLDGVVRKLDERDLLISDPQRPLALAGVMGGEDSEVSDETTDLILEVAAFDKASVAFTSRRHGLRTEASARFERGTDIEGVPASAARCAALIKDMASGRVAERVADAYPAPHKRQTIELRSARTVKLLGIDIPAERQVEHLRSIGIDAADEEGVVQATIPSFRPDLTREVDLIEEIARLEGYDKLAATVPSGPAGKLTLEQRAVRATTMVLVAQGLTEAWTSSFFSPADLDALGLDEEHPARRTIQVSNPMVEQESSLRSTMLPGLLRSVARNAAHQAGSIALFEIARIYEPTTGDLAEEELVLGAAFAGDRLPAAWNAPASQWDVFGAKGVLEAALQALGTDDLRFETIAPPTAPFHPTRGATVVLGSQTIGVVGELHPEVCQRFSVPDRTVVFEIALSSVIDAIPAGREASELPRFPSILLDLAVEVEDAVAAEKVRTLIEKAGAPEVVGVRLFDVYRGDQIREGRKSLAFALEMRDPSRTMTDADASTVRDRILAALAERVGAELRG